MKLFFISPILKAATLSGTIVINNPFWRLADDKFFGTALVERLGISVPKTFILPSHSYPESIIPESLSNLKYPVDWEAVIGITGLPAILKPHWGGGWKDVHRVNTLEELWGKYNQTGRLCMMLQEFIDWQQYVRCICIGKRNILITNWDPRKSHFERYRDVAQEIDDSLMARIRQDAITINEALGNDMNTVEFAVRDGIPYAIDFMNSAPDFDISSLTEKYFTWVVDAMATMLIGSRKIRTRSCYLSLGQIFESMNIVEKYHELLTAKHLNSTVAGLNEATQKFALTVAGRPVCNVLRPLFLDLETYKKIRTASSVFLQSFRRLADRLMIDKSLRLKLNLTPEAEAAIQIDTGFGASDVSARLDGFLGPEGTFYFVEYNADSPGGIGFGDVLSEVFLSLPIMKEIAKSFQVEAIPVRQRTFQALINAYHAWAGTDLNKAQVTIAGILNQLDPKLDQAAYLLQLVTSLVKKEIPKTDTIHGVVCCMELAHLS